MRQRGGAKKGRRAGSTPAHPLERGGMAAVKLVAVARRAGVSLATATGVSTITKGPQRSPSAAAARCCWPPRSGGSRRRGKRFPSSSPTAPRGSSWLARGASAPTTGWRPRWSSHRANGGHVLTLGRSTIPDTGFLDVGDWWAAHALGRRWWNAQCAGSRLVPGLLPLRSGAPGHYRVLFESWNAERGRPAVVRAAWTHALSGPPRRSRPGGPGRRRRATPGRHPALGRAARTSLRINKPSFPWPPLEQLVDGLLDQL